MSKRFRLKIKTCWYSDTKIQVRWTKNGWLWHDLMWAQEPLLGLADYDWEWEPVTYNLGDGDFKWLYKKFDTYEKVKTYQEAEWEKYKAGHKEVLEYRDSLEKKRKKALKKAQSYET